VPFIGRTSRSSPVRQFRAGAGDHEPAQVQVGVVGAALPGGQIGVEGVRVAVERAVHADRVVALEGVAGADALADLLDAAAMLSRCPAPPPAHGVAGRGRRPAGPAGVRYVDDRHGHRRAGQREPGQWGVVGRPRVHHQGGVQARGGLVGQIAEGERPGAGGRVDRRQHAGHLVGAGGDEHLVAPGEEPRGTLAQVVEPCPRRAERLVDERVFGGAGHGCLPAVVGAGHRKTTVL
jgi:hypothetical protein